ncbi:DUF6932 family protein [Albimonas donghaensis]|uniref:DUF6932 family protein n=1 Tax=Albimonas donghaensis TaxID=356660 RepID=UPI0011600693|nr:hypothetical protein [Albimonas donghaensis]
MPIPNFEATGALPVFCGADAIAPASRSPHQASMIEFVEKFCSSRERARLLLGLNSYRKHLFSGGFLGGAQWIDGSFVEDVEKTRGRAPRDIDVVTLFERPLAYQSAEQKWMSDYRGFIHKSYFSAREMKVMFSCDAYGVDLALSPSIVVRNTTYWFGLFSDIRNSPRKKGIVEIPLSRDPAEFAHLEGEIRSRFDV